MYYVYNIVIIGFRSSAPIFFTNKMKNVFIYFQHMQRGRINEKW